jgi:hypothetical protein
MRPLIITLCLYIALAKHYDLNIRDENGNLYYSIEYEVPQRITLRNVKDITITLWVIQTVLISDRLFLITRNTLDDVFFLSIMLEDNIVNKGYKIIRAICNDLGGRNCDDEMNK